MRPGTASAPSAPSTPSTLSALSALSALSTLSAPRTRARLWQAASAAALLAALQACVVVPQTRSVYDPACGVATQRIELEVAVIGSFQRCRGDGCVALLVSAGIVTVGSAVISGSVAVIGNVLYWAERRGGCPAPAAAPPS